MSGTYSNNLEVPAGATDDYTASIELSNACREFYRSRVQATENFKQNINDRNNGPKATKRHSTIDDAMEKLKSEMASLMDQDLSLMKQLLTLNEAIEDLKVKRMYPISKDSLRTSSQDLLASDWSVSETDMYDSDDDMCNKCSYTKVDTNDQTTSTSKLPDIAIGVKSTPIEAMSSDIAITTKGTVCKVYHGQQSSIDSGYGDTDNFSAELFPVSAELAL